MAVKSTPEIKVIAYPRSAIRKRESEGFVIAERLGDILKPGWGDYQDQLQEGGFAALNPTLDWAKHPQFDSLENIGFARFEGDGTVTFGPSDPQNDKGKAISVAYILPREAPLDSKIGANAGQFDSDNTDLNWQEDSGTWVTVPQLTPNGGTAILNRGSDLEAQASTIGQIPANRALRFVLHFTGMARTGARPAFQLTWGNKYRVTFRHDAKITLERLVLVPDEDGGQTEWQTWKTLHQLQNSNLQGGKYTIIIMRLAGRFVFRIGQASFWMLDAETSENSVSGNTLLPYSIKDVKWEAAPLVVKTINCRARIEAGVVKWSTPEGTRFTAEIKRTLPRVGSGNEFGNGFSGGWPYNGTKIEVEPVGGDNIVTWTATLTANADGIDTPCLDRVLLRSTAVWEDGTGGGVNISKAVTRAQVSLAMPPILAGSEITLDVDLWLLSTITGWQNVVKARCPVDVSIRWRYNNGGVGAWSKVLSGYVFKPAEEVNGYGSGTAQLVLRDPIMRLQKPAAVIDHRFAPLELLFLEKLSNFEGDGSGFGSDGLYNPELDLSNPFRTPRTGALYGAECVKELLRIQLGDAVAESMNGNGDPFRWLPSFQPALLSNRTDTCGYLGLAEVFGASSQSAPSLLSGNWIFPPPFGDDVLSWINKFAADDFAIFFFGWPDGDTSQNPVPIYGNYDLLIANRKLVVLPDSTITGNPHRLLDRISIETQPEKTFNRFLVWGDLGGGTSALEGLVPALRMAEARFAPSDPESAENSWELTEVLQNNIAAATGGIPGRGAAEGIAQARKNAVEGIVLEWPSFTFHGDATIQLGDVVKPQLSPKNQALGFHGATLNGALYRIERIDHALSFQADTPATFQTTVYTRPLATGDTANAPTTPTNEEVVVPVEE